MVFGTALNLFALLNKKIQIKNAPPQK